VGLHSTLVAKSFPINCTWHQVNFSRFTWLSECFEDRRLYSGDEGLHCCGITGDGWVIWNSQNILVVVGACQGSNFCNGIGYQEGLLQIIT
jgi:hypothetical protein